MYSFTKRFSDYPLRAVGLSVGQMYLLKSEEKDIKRIVSSTLWKTSTSYERYLFDDTLIRCGEKVNVSFDVLYLVNWTCDYMFEKTAFLMICFEFCTNCCEVLPHTWDDSTKAINKNCNSS